MDSESSNTKIEKLSSSNYYSWKQRILHVLALKDLEDYIEPPHESVVIDSAWRKKDRKAQALIGLSLSDQILDSTREVKSCHEMWKTISDIFERHTLLNKLSARRKFYTACKEESEDVLLFSNRIRHLASTLKSMNVEIDDSEMAMALLNGLLDEYSPLISALDALGTEETELNFEFVKARVMQEEQRINMRSSEILRKSEERALVADAHKPRPKCNYCGRKGHIEVCCWKKYPEKSPHTKSAALMAALSDEDPIICLMTKYRSANAAEYSDDWYIDSGCSNHMTFNKSVFSSYTPGAFGAVDLGNLNKARVAGAGDVIIPALYKGQNIRIKVQNVLHVPDLGYQLLSVPTWDMAGFLTIFGNQGCKVLNGKQPLVAGTLRGGLYRLNTQIPHLSPKALISKSLKKWHETLAHVNPYVIKQMKDSGLINSSEISNKEVEQFTCEGCIYGKGHRAPIPKKSESKSKQILELIHSDISGPMECQSHGGSRYFITFIDDYSKWTVVYPMKNKSDSLQYFQIFHKYAEKHSGQKVKVLNVIRRSNQTHKQIKKLRTDNGGEYLSNQFNTYLQYHGIQHQLTIAYTPQQNGKAERMNRTIMDLVRSCLHSKNLDKKFWAEALQTVTYIRNRVPSNTIENGKTPYELWTGDKPDLSNLQIFGSSCWYIIPKSKIKKLDKRSRKAIFIGYLENSKGYKLWDPELKRPISSRDVIFKSDLTADDIQFEDFKASDITDQGEELERMVSNINSSSDENSLNQDKTSSKSDINNVLQPMSQEVREETFNHDTNETKSKNQRPVRECRFRKRSE